MKNITIVSLYKFVNIEDPEAFRSELLEESKKFDIKGTFIVAAEGINGTVAGTADNISSILDYLRKDESFFLSFDLFEFACSKSFSY